VKIDKKAASLIIKKQTQQNKMSQMSMAVFNQQAPERAYLEHFINTVYQKYYQANITHFYPHLLSIEDPENNKIKAVAGLRCAQEETLFSEHYLPESLETTLKGIYQQDILRSQIVEVGNLAPANVGQMRWLIASITSFLHAAGYQYIVFTLVTGVINAFKKMGVPLQQICEAKHANLPAEAKKQWGHQYYNLNPMVLTGDINLVYHLLEDNIRQYNQNLMPLFEKAYQLGLDFKANKQNIMGQVA